MFGHRVVASFGAGLGDSFPLLHLRATVAGFKTASPADSVRSSAAATAPKAAVRLRFAAVQQIFR
jgi:hypothetical protein